MYSTNGVDLEKKDPTNVYTTPKDFFMNLGSVAALYVSVISLINLLFQVIDYAFPDRLDYYIDPYSSAVRWAIAMLVVFFPLFLVLTHFVNKELIRVPQKKNTGFRRILAYLTLFVAGLAVAIDLVALINSFLGGEITSRFTLKVLTILIIAGGVFGYYLFDLRRAVGQSEKKARMFGYIAIAVIILSLVFGFMVMGSPSKARDLRFDERRVSDLSTVQWQVGEYWRNARVLPETLEVLEKDSLYGFVAPRDPDTGEPYEYVKTGTLAFKICATFAGSSPTGDTSVGVKYYSGEDTNWTHEAGYTCFEREIDPARYPEDTKTVPVPIR